MTLIDVLPFRSNLNYIFLLNNWFLNLSDKGKLQSANGSSRVLQCKKEHEARYELDDGWWVGRLGWMG